MLFFNLSTKLYKYWNKNFFIRIYFATQKLCRTKNIVSSNITVSGAIIYNNKTNLLQSLLLTNSIIR